MSDEKQHRSTSNVGYETLLRANEEIDFLLRLNVSFPVYLKEMFSFFVFCDQYVIVIL